MNATDILDGPAQDGGRTGTEHVVGIPVTVRPLGVYVVVNGELFFAPRDLIETIVSSMLGDEDQQFVSVRSATYTACAGLPCTLAASGPAEAGYPLTERLVRFGSVQEAAVHWRELRDASELPLPWCRVLEEIRSDTTSHDLCSLPPSAIGVVTPSLPPTIAINLSTGTGRRVALRGLETTTGIGSYVAIDGCVFFAPTRTMGALTRGIGTNMRERGLAMASAFARLPDWFEENEASQADLSFSRRVVRFGSHEDVVGHRTRLAATFLLPAHSTLTRPDEARFHYVEGGGHCDHAWIEATNG